MSSSALPGVLSLSYWKAGFSAPTVARSAAEEHAEDRAVVPALSRLGSGLPRHQLAPGGTPQSRAPGQCPRGSGLLLLSAAVSLQTSESLLLLMLLQLKRSMNDVKPFPQSMK